MTLKEKIENNTISCEVGITGNCYVFSKEKELVINVAKEINKSINSVYWNSKHEVWCIRIKNKKHKELLKNVKI